MIQLRHAANPLYAFAEAFNLPDHLLFRFRVIFFPMRIVWRRCSGIERRPTEMELFFPTFHVRRTMVISQIAVINHRNELFTCADLNFNLSMGDVLNPSYRLYLGMPIPQLPGV